MNKPLAIDLFTGLHGWSEGLTAHGWFVIGVDLEDLSKQFGLPKPDNFALLIQDVLTLHGSQFKDADLIVASPPCQEYSYMAMPWSRAKAKAAAIRADETGVELERLNRLFNACFRIQREASAAVGRHIPMVVENVVGAQRWVGRARWAFGSYYLWGDVPALMPCVSARKLAGFRFDGSGRSFQSAAVKTLGAPHIRDGEPHTKHLTNPAEHVSDWFRAPSRSPRRKEASALIAKIPFALSEHIARTFKPRRRSHEQLHR